MHWFRIRPRAAVTPRTTVTRDPWGKRGQWGTRGPWGMRGPWGEVEQPALAQVPDPLTLRSLIFRHLNWRPPTWRPPTWRPLTRYLSIALAVAVSLLVLEKIHLNDFTRCQEAYADGDTEKTLDYCARPRAVHSLLAHHRALAHEYLGAAYTDDGQYEKAIAEETEALAIEPARPSAYHLRASAYYWSGQYDAAVADLRRAIALRPDNAWDQYNLASALWKQGDLAAAIAAGSEAVRLAPREGDGYELRAEIYAAQGKLDRAIKDLRQGLRLQAGLEDGWVHSNLCRYLDAAKAAGDAMGDCAMITRRDLPLAPRPLPDPEFAAAGAAFAQGQFEAGTRILRSLAAGGKPQAQRALGDMYRYGWNGAQPDAAEAMRWYVQAAATGDAESQALLGTIYAEGKITPQNDPEALRLYRLAAAQGNAVALTRLAEMYFAGTGVTRDPAQGMKWLRLAAGTGYGREQYALGSHYETGDGVRRDKVLAYMWYDLEAHIEGPALAAMSRLAPEMTEAQLEHAEYLAATCRNSFYRDCGDITDGGMK